eukprot:Opistho-2@32993
MRTTWCLANLSLNETNRYNMHKAGIVPPLVDQLASNNLGTVELAIKCLANLALEEYNREAVAASGGVQILMDMAANDKYAAVRLFLSMVLANLTLTDASRVALYDADGITVAMRMCKQPLDDMVIENFLKLTLGMAFNEFIRSEFLKVGARETVEGIRATHTAQRVQDQAAKTLLMLNHPFDPSKLQPIISKSLKRKRMAELAASNSNNSNNSASGGAQQGVAPQSQPQSQSQSQTQSQSGQAGQQGQQGQSVGNVQSVWLKCFLDK